MELLEYRFTEEQNISLSTQATALADALRPANLEKPVKNDLSVLAATSALYESLGDKHPLFENWWDIAHLKNCPTHLPITDDVFSPAWFMENVVSGAIQRAIGLTNTTNIFPSWHQDNYGASDPDGAIVTLFCENPGKLNIPTLFLSGDRLRKNTTNFDRLTNLGFTFKDDSRGKTLLNLPPDYWHEGTKRALSEAACVTKPIATYYDRHDIVVFRDKDGLHRTGIAEANIGAASEDNRKLFICLYPERKNYDYKMNPKTALANLENAARDSTIRR